MSVAQPEQLGGPGRSTGSGGAALAWTLTIVFNIALPIVTYVFLSGRGMSDVAALAISGVWPAIELGISFARTRHLDELSILVLIFLVVGVLGSLVFNSPRLLLIKDSALTGIFGIVLLASLLAPRPLMFYFGRKFATGGVPARVAWWNGLWQYEGFRRGQRMLTVVWGTTLLAEAALRIVLTLLLPVRVMVVINNVLPYVVLAALVIGTTIYGRRREAANPGPAPAGGPQGGPPAGAVPNRPQ